VCASIGPKGQPPELPDDPAPLEGANSKFDDYNSAAAYATVPDELVFSSNRWSEGQDFDLTHVNLRFEGPRVSVDLPTLFAPSARSNHDELGPAFSDIGSGLVFASNRPGGAGKLDLYRTTALNSGNAAPVSLAALNSAANDAYWTAVSALPGALFASDRGGRGFDIYHSTDRFGGSITRVEELSSAADDTAPFAFVTATKIRHPKVSLNPGRHSAPPETESHVEVVFASRRAGGAGNYDLYCSRWLNDRWAEPRPIPRASSADDDFRPIVVGNGTILIFSSNRPGGLGGFDLYYMEFSDPFD